MTREDQKRKEWQVLEYYMEVFGVSGAVLLGDEPPDFYIKTGEVRIGVEVTEYHRAKGDGGRFSRTQVEASFAEIRKEVIDYRKGEKDLENLSVLIEFKEDILPNRSEIRRFVRDVHFEIQARRGLIGDDFLNVRESEMRDGVAKKYIREISLRECNCYMEWDSNLMVASVGTSAAEMSQILSDKLKSDRPGDVDEYHLVILGDGCGLGSYIGRTSAEMFRDFDSLNEKLEYCAFDRVAVLNSDESCLWQRGLGWVDVIER